MYNVKIILALFFLGGKGYRQIFSQNTKVILYMSPVDSISRWTYRDQIKNT